MIVDRLANYNSYPFGNPWQLAFDFLLSLKPDAEEKKYPLQGDDLFAIVMRYETCSPETAEIEAHRKYLDIQMVITGDEGIGWSPADALEIAVPYDASLDAELYKHPRQGLLRVDLFPGDFMALFPHDAHMPSLMTGEAPVFTKKVVVKIGMHLLSGYPRT
ncbi:YhcH/YjgK/YiaL family protein [Thiovibrio frasassiensis]|uniref:YhcH/YjgK/YiaL family protein n=1 Tax=Thiovibrio frasassiensis TaxID=2984131 RepID=A0A9X4MGP5_9BACT|nr:YhcH/YjgK/YiaL family protein [Thiovibrio frasassiensis]MDG4476006.1 YhcH/YjgK/YiaL family protein [Thiovibrio frasassiensis]